MTISERGIISLSLNDSALFSEGFWYPELGEFEITDMPPDKYRRWAIPGLTYPLSFKRADGSQESKRVYAIPASTKTGLRFKVYKDSNKIKDLEKQSLGLLGASTQENMSPSLQRLAALLKMDKKHTEEFVKDVYKACTTRPLFRDIGEAAKIYKNSRSGVPTPIEIAKIYQAAKASEELAQRKMTQKSLDKKSGRKHTSVWEIRK